MSTAAGASATEMFWDAALSAGEEYFKHDISILIEIFLNTDMDTGRTVSN